MDEDGSWSLTLGQASLDFRFFLRQFGSYFPRYFQNKLYIAGESFVGRFAPRFASDMVSQLGWKVDGVVLGNPLIDHSFTYLGYHEMFCTDTDAAKVLKINKTSCDAMEAASM